MTTPPDDVGFEFEGTPASNKRKAPAKSPPDPIPAVREQRARASEPLPREEEPAPEPAAAERVRHPAGQRWAPPAIPHESRRRSLVRQLIMDAWVARGGDYQSLAKSARYVVRGLEDDGLIDLD